MILKFDDGDGGWICFDAVSKYHLDGAVVTVRGLDEMKRLGTGHTVLVASDRFKGGGPVAVQHIKFSDRTGAEHSAFYTARLFVCSDAGDTVDRFHVGATPRK